MLEFDVAIDELETENAGLEYPYEIKVAGRICRYRRPELGEFSVTLANFSRFRSDADKIGAAVDLLHDVCEPADGSWLISLLMNPRIPTFDFPQVVEIIEMMIEEWTGRPTQQSSASTDRQRTTGPGTKPSTPASTSSESILEGS